MKENHSNAPLANTGRSASSSGRVRHNLDTDELQQILLQSGEATSTDTGALVIRTGKFTGRAPKDKFIVKDDLTREVVAWGGFNHPFDPEHFEKLHQKMLRYFENRERYVRDVYAGADTRYRVKVRTTTEKPWSDLFVYNMFIAPDKAELPSFEPEWKVYCAPSFRADPQTDKTRSENFSIIDFTRKILLVGGSGFTGEIKKGMFTVLNFILPHQHHVLSMHCSANIGPKGDTCLFFGLSGTGKTTLSADPTRLLVGDDEHGWTADNTIFNFEGGCYAKTINITRETEPDIFAAIRKGALLENVGYYPGSDRVDYADVSTTENTRVSYPLHHIRRIATPSVGGTPKNIFFLTCDAYGVLPPISRLTPAQAAFHFVSGYTAKIPGTEAGIKEPTTTFSACFSAPFIPLPPTVYAEMLSAKMKKTGAEVWLVNTGWSGGPYGVGKRMSLPHTRRLIEAALEGQLAQVEYTQQDIFGLRIPASCPGVPDGILNPQDTWSDKEAYRKKALELAEAFNKNFEKFSHTADPEIRSAAPQLS